MSLIDWFIRPFSGRRKALSTYRRGLRKAKKLDFCGAIADYTQSIAMSKTPADVRAMVLYKRALLHVASGDESKGVVDLQAVLAMNDDHLNMKTMARQKLAGMASRASTDTKSRN